ncbi:MAG: hypothetical protein WC547_03040 [Candidatus Omnitrophota bacterium]
MVKRKTFWEIAIAVSLLVIVCACGLAVAKERLSIKYLPVDYDTDLIRQEYSGAGKSLVETSAANCDMSDTFIKTYFACNQCRDLDEKCPDCCLYNDPVKNTLTKIHCDASDPVCRAPGVVPFNCTDVKEDCEGTFPQNCACVEPPKDCSTAPLKCQDSVTPCYEKGCPNTTKPIGGKCTETKPLSDVWICDKGNLDPKDACPSGNPAIESCDFDADDAYEIEAEGADWKYTATDEFKKCIKRCVIATAAWEKAKNDYTCATVGDVVCPNTKDPCKAGFNNNCKEGTSCVDRVSNQCTTFYTAAACEKAGVATFREKLLRGELAGCFQEIDNQFRFPFVARSGEQYIFMWTVLFNGTIADSKYNIYTLVKIIEQPKDGDMSNSSNQPAVVFESIVHEKALSSVFTVSAQTGVDLNNKSVNMKAGRAYEVRLYYFLPEGAGSDKVSVKLSQLIMYRTRN